MLSKAPNKSREMMEQEDEDEGSSIPKEMKADKQIASSMLTQAFLSEQGEASLVTALQSPEPAKAVAVIISQIMEMALTESMNTDTPMSPEVWLMEDGAIDEAEDDIEAVAVANDIALPEDFAESIIDNVAMILQKRGESGAAMEQGGGMGGAPSPAPMPAMGGMPNGMG